MKVVQVCPENKCDKKPEQVEVGNIKHNFCCMKGFEISLKQFNEFVANRGELPLMN